MNIINKIKALWVIKKAVDNLKEAKMKSGFLTSEFWLAVLSQAVPVIIALWGVIPTSVMVQVMGVSGILAGIYALARALVKASASKTDDVKFNKLIAIIKPIADKIGIPVEPL